MPKDFLTIDRRKLELHARRGSAAVVARITRRTAVIAASRAPGSMKDKIRPIITGGFNPLGIVMVDHPAASFVLQGTKPHWIKPKKPGGVLRFEVGGTVVFTPKPVWHPGTDPNNFLWDALVAARM
jgi:hypothetical protein